MAPLRKAVLSAIAAVVVLSLAACNPYTGLTYSTVEGGTWGVTENFTYTGPTGWLQVWVASAPGTSRVEASGESTSIMVWCMEDVPPYGADLLNPCLATGTPPHSYLVSPYRATFTEGVNRGWKTLISMPNGTSMTRVRFKTFSVNVNVTLSLRVIDGNGNPVGDLTPTYGPWPAN